MIFHRVSDWNDAYANTANIPGGTAWPEAWAGPALAYRNHMAAQNRAKLDLEYGQAQRNRFDIFLPQTTPQGLVVFFHGGFWQKLDNSFWSHLAQGPVSHGFAVAIPSYTLCPQVRLSRIVVEAARAIETAAERINGPIHLTGHSAGGQLVARMISATSPLRPDIRKRVGNVVSISGLHDLRPLIGTELNEKIGIDAEEARLESPALLEPGENARLFCWAGGNERAEFIRQNKLLANIWQGLGAATGHYEEPDRHHYNVLDGLTDPNHPLTRILLSV